MYFIFIKKLIRGLCKCKERQRKAETEINELEDI